MEASLDTSSAIDDRIEDLLSAMSLEEKLVQLSGAIFPWGNFPARLENGVLLSDGNLEEALREGLGGISYVNCSLHPEESALWTNALQRHVRENTRLGIPLLIFEECCHGQLAQGSTIFPILPWTCGYLGP